MNLEQILAGAVDGLYIGVTVMTNQDNGIASYAVGRLLYNEATLTAGGDFRPARLFTGEDDLLDMFISDRVYANSDSNQRPQRFSVLAPEKLKVWISLTPSRAAIQIPGWGGTSSFATEAMGNMLVGLGPSLGAAPHAVWVFAFSGVVNGPFR